MELTLQNCDVDSTEVGGISVKCRMDECNYLRHMSSGGNVRSYCADHQSIYERNRVRFNTTCFRADCSVQRHITSGGTVRSYCLQHHRIVEKSGPKTTKSCESMRLSRKRRIDVVDSIDEGPVSRIAKAISRMFKGDEFVIIHDVIPNAPVYNDNDFANDENRIIFSKKSTQRYIRRFKCPENFVPDVISAVNLVFSQTKIITLDLITSRNNDKPQTSHTDLVSHPRVIDLARYHYSAVIAMSDDTKILITEARISTNIPKFGMILFRGSFLHAGAGYTHENSRLFLSISSDLHPVSDSVGIIL